MNTTAVNYRIGTGKVNVFKHAKGAGDLIAMVGYAFNTALLKNNNFTGLYITDKLCTHRIKGTAFGSYNVSSIGRFAVAKGSKAVFVPCGDKL